MALIIADVAFVVPEDPPNRNFLIIDSIDTRSSPILVRIHSPITRTMMAMAASVILPVPNAITPSLVL